MRVGAFLDIRVNGAVSFLGYGEYTGESLPDEGLSGFSEILRKSGVKVPRIVLDSGEVIFGCECWWDEEYKVREVLSNSQKIVQVSISEYRKSLGVQVIEEL